LNKEPSNLPSHGEGLGLLAQTFKNGTKVIREFVLKALKALNELNSLEHSNACHCEGLLT